MRVTWYRILNLVDGLDEDHHAAGSSICSDKHNATSHTNAPVIAKVSIVETSAISVSSMSFIGMRTEVKLKKLCYDSLRTAALNLSIAW